MLYCSGGGGVTLLSSLSFFHLSLSCLSVCLQAGLICFKVTVKVWWPQEERLPTRNSSHKRETERERESRCFRNMYPILYIALKLKSTTQLCVKSGKQRPWFTQTPPHTCLASWPKWGHAVNAFLFVCVCVQYQYFSFVVEYDFLLIQDLQNLTFIAVYSIISLQIRWDVRQNCACMAERKLNSCHQSSTRIEVCIFVQTKMWRLLNSNSKNLKNWHISMLQY